MDEYEDLIRPRPEGEFTIDVLSVARGDLRLTFDSDSVDEAARAKKVIGEMLRAGYTIFVDTPTGLRRVKRYDPTKHEYVIVDSPSPTSSRPEGRVPAKRTRAKAVGSTAGG